MMEKVSMNDINYNTPKILIKPYNTNKRDKNRKGTNIQFSCTNNLSPFNLLFTTKVEGRV